MQFPQVLVIGIGNSYRGDDAVGLAVAQRIRQNVDHAIAVREFNTPDLNLHESWTEKDFVIILDAVASGGRPGTIFRLDATRNPLPSSMFHRSTHSFGIAEAIELARLQKKLPATIVVYGIEGANFLPGEGLSQHVSRAVDILAEMVLHDVRQVTVQKRSHTHA